MFVELEYATRSEHLIIFSTHFAALYISGAVLLPSRVLFITSSIYLAIYPFFSNFNFEMKFMRLKIIGCVGNMSSGCLIVVYTEL